MAKMPRYKTYRPGTIVKIYEDPIYKHGYLGLGLLIQLINKQTKYQKWRIHLLEKKIETDRWIKTERKEA